MTNGQPDWNAVMKELQRIANALENPRFEKVSEEAPIESAPRNVDYLALRQLMGRELRQGESSAVLSAGRKKGTGTKTILTVGELPDEVEEIAVFTRRGAPTDVVDISGHTTTFSSSKTGLVDYPLDNVKNDQVITRLEFRRADGYPLALGPRLLVV